MSETKWTPGPWAVDYLDHAGQRVVRNEDIEICTCWHHSVGSIEREMEANAALIAAAPALYAALAKIEFDWDGEHEDMVEARAALAAARGES